MAYNGNNSGSETVVVKGVLITETAKAVLMAFEDVDNTWLPKSQFKEQGLVCPDGVEDECTLFIPRWLAEKAGINYDEYDPDDWEEDTLDELVF